MTATTKPKKHKKSKRGVATPEQAAAVRAWAAANPGPTFEHEAFGTTWQVPRNATFAHFMWLAELEAAGRSFEDLRGPEIVRFMKGVIGPELFDAWVQLDVQPEQLAVEVGKVFAEQVARQGPVSLVNPED